MRKKLIIEGVVRAITGGITGEGMLAIGFHVNANNNIG